MQRNQSIKGGIRRGARCLAYPTALLLAVTPHKSPCRLPSYTERLPAGSIDLPQPRVLWASRRPPPSRVAPYVNNPTSRVGFRVLRHMPI